MYIKNEEMLSHLYKFTILWFRNILILYSFALSLSLCVSVYTYACDFHHVVLCAWLDDGGIEKLMLFK